MHILYDDLHDIYSSISQGNQAKSRSGEMKRGREKEKEAGVLGEEEAERYVLQITD